MNVLRAIWMAFAAFNLFIQLMYFFRDSSLILFNVKKISTPVLLFGGFLIVIAEYGSFQVIPCIIFLAMGLGEIGIEGSSVVETHEGESAGAGGSVIVMIAAILFLLVNIFIGMVLLVQNGWSRFAVSIGFSILLIGMMLVISIRIFKPGGELRNQMLIYSAGLVILLSGVLSDAVGGLSNLGRAGLILSISDSLVLIRMGAEFDKKSRAGFSILLSFLIIILFLYYLYMWTLINY